AGRNAATGYNDSAAGIDAATQHDHSAAGRNTTTGRDSAAVGEFDEAAAVETGALLRAGADANLLVGIPGRRSLVRA
ncbi:MAG: hypothetical protein WAM68_08665, partial [Acidobacteriaceae bacterium]